jgi:hypothetical protein
MLKSLFQASATTRARSVKASHEGFGAIASRLRETVFGPSQTYVINEWLRPLEQIR